jgi:hypothetical protein
METTVTVVGTTVADICRSEPNKRCVAEVTITELHALMQFILGG